MDLSTLESTVKALETSLDSWGHWLVFFTLLVVLGLIFEYWNEIGDLLNKRPFKWQHFLALVGAIFVTVGVAGELITEFEASRTETSLRQASSGIVLALDTLVGNAQHSANNAANAAGRANSEADSAKVKADEIGAEARLLRKQGTKLAKEDLSMESRLTNADEALEAEKKKRLKLAASLMPRKVFDQSGIIAELRRLPPHRVIFVYPDESEPRHLAEQIAMVFSMLHWPFFGRQVSSDDLPEEVSVCAGHNLPSPQSHPKLVQIERANEELMQTEEIIGPIVKAFSARGVEASRRFVTYMVNEPPSTLVIGVGEKSNAEAEEALRELGTPNPTPLRIGPSSVLMESGDRMRIPPEIPAPTARPPDAKTGKP